jgi:hypothetical protein
LIPRRFLATGNITTRRYWKPSVGAVGDPNVTQKRPTASRDVLVYTG